MKRTELVTNVNGKDYRVYRDGDGRLFYRQCGFWHGTWPEYCRKEGDFDVVSARRWLEELCHDYKVMTETIEIDETVIGCTNFDEGVEIAGGHEHRIMRVLAEALGLDITEEGRTTFGIKCCIYYEGVCFYWFEKGGGDNG